MVNDDADNDAQDAPDGNFDGEGKTQYHDAQIQPEWGCHSEMLPVIQPGEGGDPGGGLSDKTAQDNSCQ